MQLSAVARTTLAALLAATAIQSARAQQTAASSAAPASAAPEVGSMAPDFALTGATRYGVLRNPVHLSDFRGNTVVLAFFYKARTKG